MKIDLSTLFEMIEQEDKNLSKTSAPVKQEKQKETALDLQGLFSLFEQLEPSINEMANEREQIDISWDGIPDIPISEIAFGGKGQDIISQEKKERLKVFLQNIGGNSFEEKLQKLSKFLSGKFLDEDASIEKALSYLVLLKVFTSNLTDFNEKSAGTNFEAIFASLMGGEQISGGSADFADTADAMVNGERYSLKLTTSDTVGNKKHILIKTLADKSNPQHEVKYVIAHKTQVSRGVSVTFYRYVINLDNIFPLLNKNKPTNTDKMFLQSASQQMPTTAPTENPVEEAIKAVAKTNEYVRDFLTRSKKALAHLVSSVNHDSSERKKMLVTIYFYQFETASNLMDVRSIQMIKSDEVFKSRYQQKIEDLEKEGKLKREALAKASEQANIFVDQYEEVTKNISEVLKESPTTTPEFVTSEKFKAMDDQQKIQYLLRSTHAIPSTENFKIAITEATPIATIEFGPETLEKVYKSYKQKLDNSIFQIFKELKIMSLNLEAFFAGGMKDLEQAARAQQASNNINQMTERFKQQTVEPKK